MQSSQVKSQLEPLVRSLFAPSSTAACNKNLTQDVRFESPLATVHGLDAVKGVLELWATLGSEVTIRSTDYNDETKQAVIRSTHAYILPPFVRFLRIRIHTQTQITFIEDEGFGKDSVLYIDSIRQQGGLGQYLKAGGLPTAMVAETSGPLLALAGKQLVRVAHHQAHAQQLIKTQRPPTILAAALDPRRTLELVAAFVFVTAFALLTALATRWNTFVDGLVRSVEVEIDTTQAHPILNPKPIFHPDASTSSYASIPQKRSLASPSEESTTTTPPIKQLRADPQPEEAAKPENLQDNPHPGESYAAAVKMAPPPPTDVEQISDSEDKNGPVRAEHVSDNSRTLNASNNPPAASGAPSTTASNDSFTTSSEDTPGYYSTLPTPASELPPSLPPAPSSLNGVSKKTSSLTTGAATNEAQSQDNGHGVTHHKPSVDVHSDVPGAFSYSKVAAKGEHAKSSEVSI